MQVKSSKCKKMLHIIAGIVVLLFVYLASGCSIYYPTSYRAFIPKGLDSEYKEYERLCEASKKGIIYSRPIPQYIQDYYTTMQKTGFKNSSIKTPTNNIPWESGWDRLWLDEKPNGFVRLAKGDQIVLYRSYELLSNEASNKKLILPQKHFIFLKPYIYLLYAEIKMSHTYAYVYALIDSQNGEIYAYFITGVRYHTGWRQSPYLTWGPPNERKIYCKTYKEDDYFYAADPIASLHTLQSKGEKQDIEFLEQIATYFTRKQADLKDLIFQDEREDAYYLLTIEELGELIFQDEGEDTQ